MAARRETSPDVFTTLEFGRIRLSIIFRLPLVLAKDYLQQNKLGQWIPEIEMMISQHHKLRKYDDNRTPLIEVFRKGDLVDFSLGFVKCGLPKTYVGSVKNQFPNAGFHKRLVKLAGVWFFSHPLNPAPILKR